MRKVLGVAVAVAGLALAVYVGLVLLLVGGIVEVVHGAQQTPADTGAIVWGVVKAALLAESVTGVIGWVSVGLGVTIGASGRPRRPLLPTRRRF